MSLREYERVMKSAGDPTRLRILKMLEGGELCVCQMIAVLGLSQSTVSKHLFLLKTGGLVKERRDGKWVHYSLDGSGETVFARTILGCLRKWLNEDPVVARDRSREAVAREVGPAGICERGMTLPGGQKAARAVPGRGEKAAAKPAAGRTL